MSTPAIVEHEESQSKVSQSSNSLPPEIINPVVHEKALFEDSLLEASGGQRKQRTLATFISLGLQCLLLSVLILIPLWFTDVLPKQQLVTFLLAPPPPPPPPPAPAPARPVVRIVKVTSEIANGQLRTPTSIPTKVRMIKEEDAPPPVVATSGVVGGVPGGIPGGQIAGVIGGIISSTSSLAAAPNLSRPAAMPQRVRVSQGVSTGLLVHQVDPNYPALARQARIQGVVVLTAVIDKDGKIQNLQLVSGHPMLAPAAIEAVKHWRYKPFLLNGEPVGIETTVTVTFRFAG